MKTGIVVLMLLLVPFASAQSLYNSWHNAGDTFKVGSDEFFLDNIHGDDKVYVSIGGKGFILRPGQCSISSGKEICLRELEESLDSEKVKYDSGRVLSGIKIEVSEFKPKISISRSADDSTLKMDQRATVSVTLKNDGAQSIDSFVYSDEFVKGLKVLQSDPGKNLFIKKGSIGAGKSMSFSYDMKLVEAIEEFESQADLSYSYQGTEANTKSSVIKFSVSSPYDLEFDVDKETIGINEEVEFSFVLKNEEDDDITVKNLLIASDMDIEEIGAGLNTSNKGYFWKGVLEPSEEISFANKFSSQKTGKYIISLTGLIEDAADEVYKFYEEVEVEVEFRSIVPKLVLIPDSVTNGSKVSVRGLLDNQGNVQIKVVGASLEVFDDKFTIGNEFIGSGKEEVLFNKNLVAPDSGGLFNVIFKGLYETQSGQSFNFIKEGKIRVTFPEVEVVEEEVEVVEEEVVEPVQVIEEEEEYKGNVAQRIVKAITNFFSWILT